MLKDKKREVEPDLSHQKNRQPQTYNHSVRTMMTNKLLDYEKESADMKYMHLHCEKRSSRPTMWSFALILIGKPSVICASFFVLSSIINMLSVMLVHLWIWKCFDWRTWMWNMLHVHMLAHIRQFSIWKIRKLYHNQNMALQYVFISLLWK